MRQSLMTAIILGMSFVYNVVFADNILDLTNIIQLNPNDNNEMDIYGLYNIEDPEFEWDQFKDKKGSCELVKSGLVLESKTDDSIIGTTTDLAINTESDSFVFGVFLDGKVSKDKGIGLLFDYSDNKNYRCVMFTKDRFCYYAIKNGEKSIVKQGLVKTGKSSSFNPFFVRNNGQSFIYLNGQEVTKLKNLKLNDSTFGFAIQGKNKVICSKFLFKSLSNETETEINTTEGD